MGKIDFKKQFKELYNPPAAGIVTVNVPPMRFLMADGEGDPNRVPVFGQAIEALYGAAYTLKFMLKKASSPVDYVVPPLEGLWWADDPASFVTGDKDAWKWTLMIMQPEHITDAAFVQALDILISRKKGAPVHDVRFELFDEGPSVQTLYIGPYSDEGPIIEKMHRFIADNGYRLRGKHHEIYLSDPRRTKPEKLKSILRQPVEPAR